MKTKLPGKNEFFDINKLPSEKGMLLFWISMSRIKNRQDAKNILKDVRNFSPSKVSKPNIGLNIIYGDFLYLYNNKPAPELKNSFMEQVITHRNAFQKLVEKNHLDFQIQQAFNYMVWNQLYVGCKDFIEKFSKVQQIYKKDALFQKYMKEDCAAFEKEVDGNQINFFLEEALMFYLTSHNQVKLPNEYIDNNQKWVLNCYPGKFIKSIIYLARLNPFKFDWKENPFQNAFYDLEAKQLIKFENVDLETYSVK